MRVHVMLSIVNEDGTAIAEVQRGANVARLGALVEPKHVLRAEGALRKQVDGALEEVGDQVQEVVDMLQAGTD